MTARAPGTGIDTVVVIAKEPLAGAVKTRLVPPLTHEQAADVAAAALWDTLRAVATVPAADRLLAFAGDPRHWAPEGWRTAPQPDGDLDTRLVAAFRAAGPGPAVLVGMDTPQLRAEQLAAFDPTRFDACLGRATDGGYWAIGFADPRHAAAAITGVPMSTDHTGADQLVRLRELGLQVQLLDDLTDVDTVDTAAEVARLVPHSAFAAAFARCGVGRPDRVG
ncbi:hypothetical protein SAMN05443575_4179 [Jatrophihabitans endophyticus]|uniref:Glycosyltransferase n=1 Tax=Jatrophihabitans endophyticus TaxID=1206085 RepID=A0A1M5UDG8_9ACTN|nr:DUF2064 domain-containing protein [Jatrophihabitans endophyticus]SHH60997.1 hypothetical protein SAMN05443575_4179 [Jatrophihabitans endophyticus]